LSEINRSCRPDADGPLWASSGLTTSSAASPDATPDAIPEAIPEAITDETTETIPDTIPDTTRSRIHTRFRRVRESIIDGSIVCIDTEMVDGPG
jgi:hypothetical protein